ENDRKEAESTTTASKKTQRQQRVESDSNGRGGERENKGYGEKYQYSVSRDVHETAAGALWNLAFYRENALHIVQDGGVKPLIHLCSSSVSKMARFMAALALVYMFDVRIDTSVPIGPSSPGSSKILNLDGVGRMALKHVEEFVTSFYNPQTFHSAAASLVPNALAQIAEAIRIPEAGHLRCMFKCFGPCI
ncbi:hypothetical protein Goari_019816, partial [Gossypium aridum]|nr:hypothetical protein [Gossypium aridum]